jgi:glycosyltransferase involved in cell wall biosynthesis
MEARPEWHLVLIGLVSAGLPEELACSGRDRNLFERLCALPTVHYCGAVSLAQVPPYIAACDVGLIPYCLSDFTRTSSPIKAFEYLSMGKPVVSTNIPSAIREGMEIVVSDEGDYCEAVQKALAVCSHESGLQDQRMASVAQDTVAARAKQLLEFVQSN